MIRSLRIQYPEAVHQVTCRGTLLGKLVEKEAFLSALARATSIKVEKTPHKHLGFLCQYTWSSLPGYLDRHKRETVVDYHLVLAATMKI